MATDFLEMDRKLEGFETMPFFEDLTKAINAETYRQWGTGEKQKRQFDVAVRQHRALYKGKARKCFDLCCKRAREAMASLERQENMVQGRMGI